MNRRQRRYRAFLKKALLLGLPVLSAVVWLSGSLLPIDHVEEATSLLPATPETVWRVLLDLDAMPEWRQDLTGLERLPDVDGAVRWREIQARGRRVDLERVEAISPERLVIRPVGGTWRRIYRLSRGGHGGTTLAITEERRVENPFLRVYVGVFGADRGGLESLTRDLGRRIAGRRELLAGGASR